MLKNYIKTVWRNLRKNPGYSFINIFGLAVGIACCILIGLFIRDELSYDDFHEKAERIYRVINKKQAEGKVMELAVTPLPLAPALEQEFPEVQQMVRFFMLGEQLIEYEGKKAFEPNFILADTSVFDVFDFSLVKGNPETALQDPTSLVLTEEMANKYFPNEDPIGKTLTVGGQNEYTVTGVMEDLPEQSHFNINFLGSFALLEREVSRERMESWIWQQFFTYLLLPENYDPAQLEEKLPEFIATQATPETREYNFTYDFYLQPLTDIHLHSTGLQFDWIAETGDITYIYAFSIIALFILLIACFNYMNLATARSLERGREVGVRKALGAHRTQLIRQFLGESVLLALLGLGFAMLLVKAALPVLNRFTDKSLTFGIVQNGWWLIGLVGMSVLAGLIAGSYPAFYLSHFQPGKVMRAVGAKGGVLTGLRKSLITLQFAISIVLIIATGIVFNQLEFVRSKELGFNKEQVITLPLRTREMQERYETLKAELLRHSAIVEAAASYGTPGGTIAGDGIRLPGSADESGGKFEK